MISNQFRHRRHGSLVMAFPRATQANEARNSIIHPLTETKFPHLKSNMIALTGNIDEANHTSVVSVI